MEKIFGIDISAYQGDFPLDIAISEGVQFVIIKAAGGDNGLYKDGKFERNYSFAKSLNLPIGCYFYSKALNTNDALLEANYLYENVKMEDGTMKKELSASGGYEMPGAIARWDEQIETLETFIVENDFDLSKITLTDEEGTTDAVSGVSIKVGDYVEGVQKALDEVK